jgi:hypothetical protein
MHQITLRDVAHRGALSEAQRQPKEIWRLDFLHAHILGISGNLPVWIIKDYGERPASSVCYRT